jgi:uncharacterized protein (TIGR02646 family)
MIHLSRHSLSTTVQAKLQTLTQEIQSLATFADQQQKAQELWANRTDNYAFDEIRGVLAAMCSGATRCMYCEDSQSNAIEHFKPKSLYPLETFVWKNYLYSCAICNTHKGNQFIVWLNHAEIKIHELPTDQLPLTGGLPLLLDPTTDQPLDFLVLDLLNTFRFTAHPLLNAVDQRRAEYTIDVLNLNEDARCAARRKAFGHYRDGLYALAQQPLSTQEIAARVQDLYDDHHPTVLHEIHRWREQVAFEPINQLWRNVEQRYGKSLL